MPTIVLVRHGETHWNRERRVQGHADSPLTLKGIGQAQAYGRRLAGLLGDAAEWRVLSSPLARCVQTTAILCETAGLPFPLVEMDERLKEVSTGDYAGMLKADLEASRPDFMAGVGTNAWYFRCPNGETHAQMATRLSWFLADRRPGEKLVVVSHGVAGRILRGLYAGLDPETALEEDAPQDAIFLMQGGIVERVGC